MLVLGNVYVARHRGNQSIGEITELLRQIGKIPGIFGNAQAMEVNPGISGIA